VPSKSFKKKSPISQQSNMLSPFAKFSLSDASDFLNSDDDPEGDNDRGKSGSPLQVHRKFAPPSGRNSSSDAEDDEGDNHDDGNDDFTEISCRKRPFSSQSRPESEESKNNTSLEISETHTPNSDAAQTKKRAGLNIWVRALLNERYM
jgi:hypothetical protein